jgi:hypothetical protein
MASWAAGMAVSILSPVSVHLRSWMRQFWLCGFDIEAIPFFVSFLKPALHRQIRQPIFSKTKKAGPGFLQAPLRKLNCA